MNSPAVWYLMRGSGIVSLLLLTLVVTLGIAHVQRWRLGRLPRFVTAGLHRNASLLAVSFLSLHILLAVIDPDASVSLLAAFVPFTARFAPLWVGLGSLALDVLLAIVLTSLLRSRLTRRAWKRVHLFAYGAWPLAWLHGIGAGTDSGTGWLLALELLCLATVASAATWRLLGGASQSRPVSDQPARPRITAASGRAG